MISVVYSHARVSSRERYFSPWGTWKQKKKKTREISYKENLLLNTSPLPLRLSLVKQGKEFPLYRTKSFSFNGFCPPWNGRWRNSESTVASRRNDRHRSEKEEMKLRAAKRQIMTRQKRTFRRVIPSWPYWTSIYRRVTYRDRSYALTPDGCNMLAT